MTLLAIEWSSLAVKAGQFILSFSILVVLHELGHFIPAKLFGCRVEKFFLFFNPGFSLFKIKKGETEYGIGWVPLGGFVKISGMVDESMDKEQMKLPPKDYEFRSKPAWQRLIIMVGGVVVNVILAIIIFIGIVAYWGDELLPGKNLTFGISTNTLSQTIGLKDGDKILAADGKTIDDFGSVTRNIFFKGTKELTVERDGKTFTLAVPQTLSKELGKKENAESFIDIRYPAIIDSVAKSAVIIKGELKKGDRFLTINQQPASYFHELTGLAKKYKDSAVDVQLLRGKDTVAVRALLKDGKVGFFNKNPISFFTTIPHKYSFAEAIPIGFQRCFETLSNYIKGIKKIFTKEVNANDSVGGLISIVNTFQGVWVWQEFWRLTGIFSIILAFMNILPIPALDGGHALFCLYEMITGRKPSDKFMEYAQIGGMALLLSLMVYALGLDFWRIFKK